VRFTTLKWFDDILMNIFVFYIDILNWSLKMLRFTIQQRTKIIEFWH